MSTALSEVVKAVPPSRLVGRQVYTHERKFHGRQSHASRIVSFLSSNRVEIKPPGHKHTEVVDVASLKLRDATNSDLTVSSRNFAMSEPNGKVIVKVTDHSGSEWYWTHKKSWVQDPSDPDIRVWTKLSSARKTRGILAVRQTSLSNEPEIVSVEELHTETISETEEEVEKEEETDQGLPQNLDLTEKVEIGILLDPQKTEESSRLLKAAKDFQEYQELLEVARQEYREALADLLAKS